jgi:hypothetical protein
MPDKAEPEQEEGPPPLTGKKAPTCRRCCRGQEEGLITIDEFARLDLRVAKIVAAEKVKGADKLLKLTLDVGGKTPGGGRDCPALCPGRPPREKHPLCGQPKAR